LPPIPAIKIQFCGEFNILLCCAPNGEKQARNKAPCSCHSDQRCFHKERPAYTGLSTMIIKCAVRILNDADPACQPSHTSVIRPLASPGQYPSSKPGRPKLSDLGGPALPGPGVVLTTAGGSRCNALRSCIISCMHRLLAPRLSDAGPMASQGKLRRRLGIHWKRIASCVCHRPLTF
jgi:hypothetical protein